MFCLLYAALIIVVIILVFRKLNHKEVVEEDRRNKEPKNEEARKRRAEYIVKVSTFRTIKDRPIFIKKTLQPDLFSNCLKGIMYERDYKQFSTF